MDLHKLVNGIKVPLTEEEIKEFQDREEAGRALKQEEEKVKYRELRKVEYPTIEEVIIALVEKESGRPEALEDIIAKRNEVKEKFPKPE